eukprot:5812027-Prymnesium_polylepis.1
MRSRSPLSPKSHQPSVIPNVIWAQAARVLHDVCGVQAVGGDDHVELTPGKALEARVGIDVEECVLHKREVGKANVCLSQKDVRNIGEEITPARALKDREDARRRAAGARSNLKHHDSPLSCEQQRMYCLQSSHYAPIVEPAAQRVLVDGQYRLHRTAREQEVLKGGLRRQRIRKIRAAPLNKLKLRPQVGVLDVCETR